MSLEAEFHAFYPRRTMFQNSAFRLALFFTVAIGVALTGSWLASADFQNQVQRQPASEGRPITPAGILLTDATTRLAAVTPLTVDFVRTPDKSGPDGKGRYLIAVNSGFGLQFSADTSRGQQSLSV